MILSTRLRPIETIFGRADANPSGFGYAGLLYCVRDLSLMAV